MLKSRIINFILILVGGIVAIYAKAEEDQNVYILLAGLMLLMFGLYRLSRGISSRKIDDSTQVELDDEEDVKNG